MFCKSLIVFGLLAAFSVQGMETNQLDTRTVELRALGDLINQVKELIKNLNGLVTGVLGDALKTFTGLIDTVKAIKEKFLDQGLGAIKKIIDGGLKFITDKVEEAAKLGIDISKCVVGRTKQLADLATSLAGELTDCITKPISKVLDLINADVKIIGEIIKNITNLPADLAKCLISLRPISCVTKMVENLTKLVADLPGQINQMIKEVFTFVDGLTGALGECVNGITVTATTKVGAIIDEVGKCADDLMGKKLSGF